MPVFVWSRIVCECYVFCLISIKLATEILLCSSVSLMTRREIVPERLEYSSINRLTWLLATENFCWIQSAYNVYSQHLHLKIETIPSFGCNLNTLTENRRHFDLNPPCQRLTSRSAHLVHLILRRSNLHAHSLNNSLVQIHATRHVVVFHTYVSYVCVCMYLNTWGHFIRYLSAAASCRLVYNIKVAYSADLPHPRWSSCDKW
jgi:hypothetical protein